MAMTWIKSMATNCASRRGFKASPAFSCVGQIPTGHALSRAWQMLAGISGKGMLDFPVPFACNIH